MFLLSNLRVVLAIMFWGYILGVVSGIAITVGVH
jgi:hypothetical protein